MKPPLYSYINVISKPFTIDKKYLRKDINSIKSKEHKDLFLSSFEKDAQSHRE